VGLADARDLCCWTGHRCDVLKGVLEVVETESDGEELLGCLHHPCRDGTTVASRERTRRM